MKKRGCKIFFLRLSLSFPILLGGLLSLKTLESWIVVGDPGSVVVQAREGASTDDDAIPRKPVPQKGSSEQDPPRKDPSNRSVELVDFRPSGRLDASLREIETGENPILDAPSRLDKLLAVDPDLERPPPDDRRERIHLPPRKTTPRRRSGVVPRAPPIA